MLRHKGKGAVPKRPIVATAGILSYETGQSTFRAEVNIAPSTADLVPSRSVAARVEGARRELKAVIVVAMADPFTAVKGARRHLATPASPGGKPFSCYGSVRVVYLAAIGGLTISTSNPI